MPLTLEDQSEDFIPDRRHVTIFDEQVSADGTVHLAAVVDYGDALDIETALQDTAAQLKLAGSVDTLDGRRAAALGEMARNQLALTYPTNTAEGEGVGLVEERVQRASRNRRPITLYVHLSEDALTTTAGQMGRCENARTPITADTISTWCGNPSVTLTVKPVIDLADHVRVDAYEVPDRLKERIALRDLGCVFPWCTRPARTACDHDHAIPHDQGGPTCTCNIAPLCRHHHRLKTHTPWRYRLLEPGVYLWTSPHGYVFLRDPSGTVDVTPAGLVAIPGCPDPTVPDPDRPGSYQAPTPRPRHHPAGTSARSRSLCHVRMRGGMLPRAPTMPMCASTPFRHLARPGQPAPPALTCRCRGGNARATAVVGAGPGSDGREGVMSSRVLPRWSFSTSRS